MKTVKLILVVVLLLSLGFFSGLIVSTHMHKRKVTELAMGDPGPKVDALLRGVDRHLDLSLQQENELRDIFRDTFYQLNEITKDVRPRARKMFTQQTTKIREILDEQQVEKFNQLLEKRFGGKHPFPGPPHHAGPPFPPGPENIYLQLDSVLQFSPEQQSRVKQLLEEDAAKKQEVMNQDFRRRRDLREGMKKELEALSTEVEKQIMGLLTPEQNRLFSAMGDVFQPKKPEIPGMQGLQKEPQFRQQEENKTP